MTAIGTPSTSPRTSTPACPTAVETGQPGISAVRDLDPILERVGETAETATEHDSDPRLDTRLLPDACDRLVQHGETVPPSCRQGALAPFRSAYARRTMRTASSGSSVTVTSPKSSSEIVPRGRSSARSHASISSQ